MYKFTTKLANNVCRICGTKFTRDWSVGGVGGLCKNCCSKVDNLDLVELGIIRNIEIDPTKSYLTYIFEVLIDETWYKCHTPCGDWSYVDDSDPVFSVPVGWWTLDRLYKKHYRKKDETIEKVEKQHRKLCCLLDDHTYKCACNQIFREDICTCNNLGKGFCENKD